MVIESILEFVVTDHHIGDIAGLHVRQLSQRQRFRASAEWTVLAQPDIRHADNDRAAARR
ncbi:hypothetical protein [Nitrospira sp. BLG_2]|uniref:hypothetical protein n=1 Tax=Nitrospira sp. BLG_2 TaxID=3397507 RepID=UPI003B9CE129